MKKLIIPFLIIFSLTCYGQTSIKRSTVAFPVEDANLAFTTQISGPKYNITGSSSGTISLIPQAAAGTYNLNLPTTLGSAGQVWALGATPSSSAGVWVTPLTNPMTTLGDLIYGGASGVLTRLAGQTTIATRGFLTQTESGGVAAAPAYFDLFATPNTFAAQQTFTNGFISNAGVGITGAITLTNSASPSFNVQLISPASLSSFPTITLPGVSGTAMVTSVNSQTTLVAGTKTITITGLTSSGHAYLQFVSQGGTSTTTFQYAAVCSANTLTITAETTGGATNTLDTSVLNYFVTPN